MRILITGSKGQLGQALIKHAPKIINNEKIDLVTPNRENFDLLMDEKYIDLYVSNINPDWIINCAAYTQVDKAEEEPDLAYKINSQGAKSLALSLLKKKGKIIHISTDFVFSGDQNYPYKPEQIPSPISTYGKSKAIGEKYIQNFIPDKFHIIRTSWLYSSYGKNFLTNMLKLHKSKGNSNEVLSVIYDQIGCPTSTSSLARFCWSIIFCKTKEIPRILHWSDAGVCSWYDFAVEIGNLAIKHKLIRKSAYVKPIKTIEYSTKAVRPKFSLLDCCESRIYLNNGEIHWRKALSDTFQEIKSIPF